MRRLLATIVSALAACTAPAPVAPPPAASPPAASVPVLAPGPDASALRDCGAGAEPATAAGPLLDVRLVDPTIRVDLAYATAANFTGAPLPGYHAQRALLLPAAARALARAQARLRAEGLGLVVLDAYRPARASAAMVDWARRAGHPELVGPYIAVRSRHNTGAALDVALVDLTTCATVDVGVPYDDAGPQAAAAALPAAGRARWRRLAAALEAEGFTNYAAEWWHWTFPAGEGAPSLDVDIE